MLKGSRGEHCKGKSFAIQSFFSSFGKVWEWCFFRMPFLGGNGSIPFSFTMLRSKRFADCVS